MLRSHFHPRERGGRSSAPVGSPWNLALVWARCAPSNIIMTLGPNGDATRRR